MTQLWLIRHGQASFGSSDYDRLSTTGITQSRLLGRYLSESGTTFQSVFTGEMKRQADTADIVLSAMNNGTPSPIQADEFNEYDFMPIFKSQLPQLLEEDPGLSERLPTLLSDNRNFQKVFSKIMDRWISGKNDVDGIETYQDYKNRVINGINEISSTLNSDSTAAVFTSGGVISIAMQKALDLSDHEAMRLGWEIRNSSVSVFRYSKHRLNLVSFNSTAHLDLENNPELITYR